MGMETKKQHTSSSRSKLSRSKSHKCPKSLRIFQRDLTKRALNHILTHSIVAIDTETGPKPFGLNYRKGKVLLIQIATPDNKVYLIRNPDHHSQYIIELLNDRNITKTFHNAAFDISFLKASLNVETQDIACTKTLMKMLHPEIQSGLGNSIEKILNIEINKDIDHNGWDKEELDDRQIEYAANDVLYLIELYEELIPMAPLKFYDLMEAIQIKSYAEVEGYTDLFDYSQNDYRQTKRERNWWENRFN